MTTSAASGSQEAEKRLVRRRVRHNAGVAGRSVGAKPPRRRREPPPIGRRTPFESPAGRAIAVNAIRLQLKARWDLERVGERRHYVVEAWLDDAFAGRAHGWFEPGAEFVLEKIEVEPAQRSRGYGSTLIDGLRAKAREAGCREFVIKGVRARNRGAIRLYESMGARAVRTSSDLYAFVISPP